MPPSPARTSAYAASTRAWLPGYERSRLRNDVLAGAMVAALMVPQSLGYARIAGVPVEVGLYAVPLALAAFAVLGAALGYATAYVLTKDLVRTDRPLTVLFWMNLVQLPLGLAGALGSWADPSPALWPWVAVIGLSGLSSHYCLSRALACADVSLVVPLDFLRLPLAAVVAWLVYAEALDPFVFLGAVVIFAGNWINVRRAAQPRDANR